MKYQYFMIALVGIVFISVLEYTNSIHLLEMNALDARYHLRGELFRDQKTSDQIVIIGIDDTSIANIKQPFILWDTFFAEIIEKLGKYHAEVIGLDLIWTKRIDDYVKRPNAEKNALRRALLIAKNRDQSHIVMGIGATTRKMNDTRMMKIEGSLPMKQFGAIVGRDGFGVVNTVPDADNYIRKIRLQYQSAEVQNRALLGFSNRIASHFLNERPKTSERPLLINYQLNNHFKILSFEEVLKQSRTDNRVYFEKYFKDKIVLIGVTNISGDILPSPVAQETPGILIHAHAIEMLIHNNLLIEPHRMFVLLFNIFMTLLVVYYASKSTLSFAIMITISVIVLYSLINLLLFNINILLPYIGSVILILWSFSVSFFYRFITEERMKRRLANFFRSYVNEEVVKEIINSDTPIVLEGKREKIAILFVDIRNFTAYAEHRSAEEVVRTLNEYFSAMTEVILSHNGTVDKFIGDGLMAFFGAPILVENPTLSAVKSALEMRQSLEKLNRYWASQGREQLDNGIGIHTGDALIGNIGSEMKMDYTAIGDTVNTASRVEGMTKIVGVPILITEAAYKEVEEELLCEPIGNVALKGRRDVFVYEVKNIRETDEK